MAALPTRPPIALATLLQRNARPARTTRAALTARGVAPPRTLADLERASSIAPHDHATPFVRPPTPPSALALWITVATCACGRVHRLPPTTVLIKYAENEHSVHYKRDDAAVAALPVGLPREVREKQIAIPFCEACFLSTLTEHSVTPAGIAHCGILAEGRPVKGAEDQPIPASPPVAECSASAEDPSL